MIQALRDRGRWFVARRERPLAAVVAILAGLAVFLIATEAFPYHSSNHDEGVYLQQASMLLDGQLGLFPGELADSVRPWFFVDAGDRLYPKYQPIPAAFYALAMAAVGEPRVALAAVAAGNTALVYVLGSMAFDRRVGVLAAAAFALAPMTLVTSSVFLPYAPTTLFNLLFAVLYIRSYRTGSRRTALLAGLAIGVAFFARPFTAVLFAAPFVVHALWELASALRSGAGSNGTITWLRETLTDTPAGRHLATAVVGLAFVGVALSYNAYMTGDPVRFAYEAFAPQDGPGFGHRQILSHSLEYTPLVAIEANSFVLRYLLTRWVFGGLAGAVLAGLGLVLSLRRPALLPGEALPRRLLAGLFVSVPAGNVLFWGNYNILETMSDPADGLLGQFGPFYHFDLLAPAAVFTAAGGVALWRLLRPRIGSAVPDPRVSRVLAAALLVVSLLALVSFNAALAAGPLERNVAHTETYEDAYAPFENRTFENGVVFLPTPYGEWLNHPFQYLRNEPGFDGDVVYVLNREPSADFTVLDAYPDRQLYRYDFRGEWTGDPEDRTVVPTLHPVSVRSSERLSGETVVSVPERVTHATVRVETEAGHRTHDVQNPGEELSIGWSLDGRGVGVTALDGTTVGREPVAVDGSEAVVIQVRLVQSGAGTLTYRQEVTARERGDLIEVVWPPERTVCPVVDDCGREGTYVPEESREGVTFETRLEE